MRSETVVLVVVLPSAFRRRREICSRSWTISKPKLRRRAELAFGSVNWNLRHGYSSSSIAAAGPRLRHDRLLLKTFGKRGGSRRSSGLSSESVG